MAALLGGLLLAASAAGCGGPPAAGPGAGGPSAGSAANPAAGASNQAPATPLTHVTLRLGWLMAGYDGAFVAAREQGYYRQAGLDVTIEESTGSSATVAAVAAGRDTFGFADDSTVAALIGKGAPLKVVATLVQVSPAGMIHAPSVKLSAPVDLRGRTIVANAGGGPAVSLFQAVLKRGGLSRSDVRFEIVAPSAEASTFTAHPEDVLLGFGNSTYGAVLRLDPGARFTPDAAFGISTLSSGIVTSLSEIGRHPDVVRGFVAASVRGWRFMARHPRRTVDEILREFPHADRFMLSKSLELTLPLVHTPATRGKPLGWMAASDWRTTLDLLHRYGGLRRVRPPADYYTNRFVPQA